MIWFILGVAPFVAVVIVGFIKSPEAMIFTIGSTVFVGAFVLLMMYGSYQMGWLESCGSFWETVVCS